MKFSIEAKVGLIGIVTIIVLIWGINYLKGRSILSNSYTLYAFYPESGGLEPSAPVLLMGVKIGYVDRVQLHTGASPRVKVTLNIGGDTSIDKGALAELFSADLLGSKAIRIVPSGDDQVLKDGDTIQSSMTPDMISGMQTRLFPLFEQIGSVAGSLDTLARRLDTLLAADALTTALESLTSVTGSLKTALEPGGSLDNSFNSLESFSGMLEEQEDEMASLIGSLNSVSSQLDSAGLDSLSIALHGVFQQLNVLFEQLNSEEGSAGKFFYSDSLYDNLNLLVTDLDMLVRNLNEHPEEYVQISVFGKSKK
ncbi:MAG: MlaD family protein [Bacteroidota bacterium]